MSVRDVYSAQAGEKNRRVLVTPEGVDLRVEIGDVGQRLGALLLDLTIITLSLLVLTIGAFWTAGTIGFERSQLIAVIWLFGQFAIRNAYFLLFELSPRAATPGKRVMGLRVASRDGGRLRAEAVFARNAMRELEVFLPLQVMFSGGGGGSVGGWIYLLGIIWCGVFVLLPAFNKDKLRAGDLVAGTWVVRAPKQKLLRDMADEGAERVSRFAFTPLQLEAYGVKELQVLEDVLRVRERATVRAVADRISAKIGYDRGHEADIDFLTAYYHALRGRLESRLLMGRRRKDKFDA